MNMVVTFHVYWERGTQKVYTEQGYLVILSGPSGDDHCWSGVGFVVSPTLRHRISSYKQVDGCIAWLRVRVEGGVMGAFSALLHTT